MVREPLDSLEALTNMKDIGQVRVIHVLFPSFSIITHSHRPSPPVALRPGWDPPQGSQSQ